MGMITLPENAAKRSETKPEANPVDIESVLAPILHPQSVKGGGKGSSSALKEAAEAELFRAQTAGQLIDNALAAEILKAGVLASQREDRKYRWETAADQYHRVFHFTDAVDESSVTAAITVLSRWHRIDMADGKTDPYRIVICSPGGYIHYGMKLYAFLRNLRKERDIITIASGFCASMATIIHQAGTERWIDEGTSYLVHDPSGSVGGTIGDIEDTKEWFDQLKLHGHRILAERSTMTAEEVGARAKRRDWWMLADEVVALGFADKLTDEVY